MAFNLLCADTSWNNVAEFERILPHWSSDGSRKRGSSKELKTCILLFCYIISLPFYGKLRLCIYLLWLAWLHILQLKHHWNHQAFLYTVWWRLELQLFSSLQLPTLLLQLFQCTGKITTNVLHRVWRGKWLLLLATPKCTFVWLKTNRGYSSYPMNWWSRKKCTKPGFTWETGYFY